MVLLVRVPPPAVALALDPVQVLGPVPGSVLAQKPVPGPPLDRRLGGEPPSLAAALAPLPETAQEAES